MAYDDWNKGKGPEYKYFGNYGLNTHRATRNDIKNDNNTFNLKTPDDNGLAMTSTNVFIYANGNIVGMIQSFSVGETRNIDKLSAIGVEGVVQAVPQNTNGGSLDINRMALYSSNLWAALGLEVNGKGYDQTGSKVYKATDGSELDKWDTPVYEKNDGEGSSGRPLSGNSRYVFKTLKDQRVPLEIQVKTPLDGEGKNFYIETYVDCWLASYSKSYDVGKITVAESCKIDYADVY